MGTVAQAKWDAVASQYDRGAKAAERRWAPEKRALFSHMRGKILFVAAGTGLDFEFFPAGQNIRAIDISPKMLELARPRAEEYAGEIELRRADVEKLDDPSEAFDQVYTACTFCSVPDPVRGLRELRRVLRPGGELRMFEHTGSRWIPFKWMLELMTPLSRLQGPSLNRDTIGNVQRAGFEVRRVTNVYLDVVKTICAVKP